MKKYGIGIIGTGNIVGQYLDTISEVPHLEIVALADRNLAKAGEVANRRGLVACSVAELLENPEIALVINLTNPGSHVEVDREIIKAGKHVISEKPLALSLLEGQELLAAAEAAGVAIGSAPDTFLGTGLQTTALALREGRIGEPFAASACWGGPGPEPWHPNPQFFYLPGGGPVLDMGPYYITALVAHLGPVRSVTSRTTTSNRKRIVGSGPLAGSVLRVETPTYAAAILEHTSGVLSSVSFSFETWASGNQLLEIYGTSGTLQLPDPNHFSLKGRISEMGADWTELVDAAGFVNAGRGIGAAELVRAVEVGRTPRASGQLALHVAEVLFAINQTGQTAITTTVEIPELVPLGADVASC